MKIYNFSYKSYHGSQLNNIVLDAKNLNAGYKPEAFGIVCTLTYELYDDTLTRFLQADKRKLLGKNRGKSKNRFRISACC